MWRRALLDLQMPEIGGLDVVRRVSRSALPLVAFATAFDDYLIRDIDIVIKRKPRSRRAARICVVAA
jgi:CheY-like chemotaxis protein